MRDYRLKKNGCYIREVTSDILKDGTEVLNVKFANGRVFKNILYDKENMKKIVEQQENQAQEGINNLPLLKKKLKKQGIITGCTGMLGGITGYGISQMQELLFQNDDPIILPLSIGLLTITGLAIGLGPLIKNKMIIGEIEKIKFCEENRHDLRAYIYYPNSLVNVNKKSAEILRDAKKQRLDPFYTINVDCFTRSDLENIVENVHRERKYKLKPIQKTYSK